MTATTPLHAAAVDRLAAVLDLHFHPRHGTPFWLKRAARLGIDPRAEIRRIEDLDLLGVLDRAELAATPLCDLVPRAMWKRRGELMLSETGGTSGTPLRTVYDEEEFHAAFVAPFLRCAGARGFPSGGQWLFLGPSGPHVIHRAARAFARAGGALEPFCVDFDPRWARAQSPGSFGARAYRRHVVAQALDVLLREEVDVLFATPPVLSALADELDEGRRAAIRGIHVGGMAFPAAARDALALSFPNAVILPAYGNSMVGIAPEMDAPAPGAPARYAVPLGRMRYRVIRDASGAGLEPVAMGRRGRVVLDRLDPSFLLVNLVERDDATAVPASAHLLAQGFRETVLEDPGPAAAVPAEGGLY